MGLKDFFKFRKWTPDLERPPPPKHEWPDHIITLNTKKFDNFINKYPVAIIDFWASWCKPCMIMAPRIRQLSKMYKGKVAFGKVNIDNYNDLAKRYHILGIPNLVFFSYGDRIINITGAKQLKDVKEEIDRILTKFEK